MRIQWILNLRFQERKEEILLHVGACKGGECENEAWNPGPAGAGVEFACSALVPPTPFSNQAYMQMCLICRPGCQLFPGVIGSSTFNNSLSCRTLARDVFSPMEIEPSSPAADQAARGRIRGGRGRCVEKWTTCTAYSGCRV